MKKILKSLIVFTLMGIMMLVSGCGGMRGKKGVLTIRAVEGGHGNTYLSALVEEYQKYNPNVKIDHEMNPLIGEQAQTELDANNTAVDLFFTKGLNIGRLVEKVDSLEPLDDVLYSKAKVGEEEEDVNIIDKLNEEFMDANQFKGNKEEYYGKYFAIPYSTGPCSLVLNIDVLNQIFGEDGWSEPRTSNELLELADKIKAANATVDVAGEKQQVYPFIYAGNAVPYWRYMYYVWFAQYSGADAWMEWTNCKIDGEYTQDAKDQEGLLKAMTIMEKILKAENGYCHPSSMDNTHTSSQKYFFQGRAAMMVVGHWLETEMTGETTYNPELKMIRTPVISDLGEIFEGTATEQESKLRLTIDAVNEGKTYEEAGVTHEQYERVETAMKYVFNLGNTMILVIPKVAVNKDLAKDFLRFMYSDVGAEIMLRESGALMPFKDATVPEDLANSYSGFKNSVLSMMEDSINIMYDSSDPIKFRAGMPEWLRSEKPEISMAKTKNALSAKEILESEKTILSSSWQSYMNQVL